MLSPVSNHVFEKRLIVKFIQQTGNDPINGEPLSEDQLLDIKGNAWCMLHVVVDLTYSVLFHLS